MTNFLYCFDSNYNVQATVSISTLLEKYDSEVNLYILHDNPILFEKYTAKLKKYNNLNKIEIFKFEDTNYDFPNLNNSHVSYATYFRMFISNYLPKDLDFLIYLDADILCLSNPRSVIEEEINKLKSSDNVLTGLNEEISSSHKQKLGIKNNRYFNAGLIIINYQKWSKLKMIDNLLNIMKSNFTNIVDNIATLNDTITNDMRLLKLDQSIETKRAQRAEDNINTSLHMHIQNYYNTTTQLKSDLLHETARATAAEHQEIDRAMLAEDVLQKHIRSATLNSSKQDEIILSIIANQSNKTFLRR